MSTRAELEAALARAEVGWRRAHDDLDRAQANLRKANADWDRVVSDRRKAEADRRKPDSVWDQVFPDRRKAAADRRRPGDDLAALAKAVTDRHTAYSNRSKAEAERAEAESRVEAAGALRGQAIAALDQFDRAQRKP